MSASTNRKVLIALSVIAVAVLAGCLSRGYPEKRQYVIVVERREAGSDDVEAGPVKAAPGGLGVLRITRVRVGSTFERKGFVYRTDDATYERDFYNEFFAPPGILIREAVGGWLNASSVFSSVTGASDPSPADWLLEARVHELYADVRDRKAARCVMRMSFKMLDAWSPRLVVAFEETYSAEVEAENRSAEGIAAAWNSALAQILTELEDDLRSQSQGALRRPRRKR
jgi:uncharacterized lipoprotein YmbA